MAEPTAQSNNIRAGAFILLATALGISVFVILSGWNPFEKRIPYKVRFTVDQGVDGLASGSDVKVGGLIKGTVTGITPQFTPGKGQTEKLDSILVDFQVDKDVSLWSNAEVTRYMPLLGGGAWLNFDNVGQPVDADGKNHQALGPGGELNASAAGGMLATLLGPSNAAKTGQALSNIEDFTDFLDTIPKAWDADVVPMLADADAVLTNMRTDYGTWSGQVTEFLDRADSAAGKLDSVLDDVPTLMASAQKDLDQVGDILDANGDKIATALDNIVVMTNDGKVIFEEIRTDTMGKINTILDDGERGLDAFSNALTQIEGALTSRLPSLEMMLADLRQAGAQLKLTALEVRRSPWKLLYTPSTDEVAHENLYESARSYVMATNDLEAAALAFKQVFEIDPEILERNPELREQVETYVLDAIERYKEIQTRLFSEIVDQ